jgi:hypothetical protein
VAGEVSEVLEVIAALIAALKTYRAKVPEVLSLAVAPGGLKPSLEAVEAYEQAIARFRALRPGALLRPLNTLLIESLEAFEAGNVLKTAHPLLGTLDHLDLLQREKKLTLTNSEIKRLEEFRATLQRLLPGNQPELEGAGRGIS